ncbi:MAG: hypothetical protein Q8N08_09380 [Methanobacteriaceae archaeon]|nr:hypothetical protein [Methanobacteriaceae archaeon]
MGLERMVFKEGKKVLDKETKKKKGHSKKKKKKGLENIAAEELKKRFKI